MTANQSTGDRRNESTDSTHARRTFLRLAAAVMGAAATTTTATAADQADGGVRQLDEDQIDVAATPPTETENGKVLLTLDGTTYAIPPLTLSIQGLRDADRLAGGARREGYEASGDREWSDVEADR